MKQYEEKKFKIPKLVGLSEKSIEEHLKLYAGYVKHANLVNQKIAELNADSEKNAYALAEVNRRFSFEFNGMRNHEVYFSSLEGGSSVIDTTSKLHKTIAEEWGSFDNWLGMFKAMALTRGIGWAMLYYDRETKRLISSWVDEQHLGQLQNCELILGLDMWEHSFVADYAPSGKKKYVEDYFTNLNWKVPQDRFAAVA